jgi:hypothetical protein
VILPPSKIGGCDRQDISDSQSSVLVPFIPYLFERAPEIGSGLRGCRRSIPWKVEENL